MSMQEDTPISVDLVIVGAGVVGCATAARICSNQRKNVLGTLVLEQGPRIAEGVTSRNSGVIHAGLYYKADSLKTQLCIRGQKLLYEWAAKQGVPHDNCGKLVVSPDEDSEDLSTIYENALKAGASGLEMLSKEQIKTVLPNEVRAKSAFLSNSTGIIDPFELSRSLKQASEQAGAEYVFNCGVTKISFDQGAYLLSTNRGEIRAQFVILCAGLNSDEIELHSDELKIITPKIFPWR